MLYSLPPLTLRSIDVARDADLCAANHYDACLASFGQGCAYEGRDVYLKWLRENAETFPEGFALAFDGDRFVGQVELQVPYGLKVGYINLFYISPDMRGRGYGKLLHDYAERYFRSWEAESIELHVSPQNIRAIRFYRRLGYEFANESGGSYLKRESRLWRMKRSLNASKAKLQG